jgi:hypothetical protein
LSTDAGLELLRGLTVLVEIHLHNAEQITNAGLEPIQDLRPLAKLDVTATRVSHTELAIWERLTPLNSLDRLLAPGFHTLNLQRASTVYPLPLPAAGFFQISRISSERSHASASQSCFCL